MALLDEPIKSSSLQGALQNSTTEAIQQPVEAAPTVETPEPAAAPQSLDAAKVFKNQFGMNVKVNDEGETTFFNPDSGEQEPFDARGELERQGITEEEFGTFEFNTPDTAVATSPLTMKQRVAMGAGGKQKDIIDFLAESFQNATYSPENGIVVLDKGVWHIADPDLLARGPWELTKDVGRLLARAAMQGGDVGIDPGELDKDFAQLTAKNLPLIGTLAGLSTGGFMGGAAGAIIGKQTQISLGRALGTYGSTSLEEERHDVAMDGFLQVGFGLISKIPGATKFGKDVAVSIARTGPMVKMGEVLHINTFAKSMKAWGQNASESVKSIAAKAWSATTGASENAIKAGMEGIDDVVRAMKSIASKTKQNTKGIITGDNLKNTGKDMQIAEGGKILGELIPGLKRFWNREAVATIKLTPPNYKVNMTEIANEAGAMLEKSGIVKRNTKGIYSLLTESEKDLAASAGKRALELTKKRSLSHGYLYQSFK